MRRIRRASIKAKYRFKKMHYRIGRMAEISHLAYFGVLAAEAAGKSWYAKCGIACMILSVLYMITEEKEK